MASIVFTQTDAQRLLSNSANGVVRIPDDVTEIAACGFAGCTNLTSVQFPNGLTEIGEYAFACYRNLTSVQFPNGLTKIGAYAFHGCTNLTSTHFPNGLTWIGAGAFEGCFNLISFQFPNSVTRIGWGAFAECTNLSSVKLPSLTEIKEAFAASVEIVRVDEVNSQMHAGSQVMGGLIHCLARAPTGNGLSGASYATRPYQSCRRGLRRWQMEAVGVNQQPGKYPRPLNGMVVLWPPKSGATAAATSFAVGMQSSLGDDLCPSPC